MIFGFSPSSEARGDLQKGLAAGGDVNREGQLCQRGGQRRILRVDQGTFLGYTIVAHCIGKAGRRLVQAPLS